MSLRDRKDVLLDQLEIRAPDDWHVHLRDGEELKSVVGWTAKSFRRAIVMPNLKEPITTIASANKYRQRIRAALEKGSEFEPLMTFYLTDKSDPEELQKGLKEGVWVAAKLYPAHATTNTEAGVTDLKAIYPCLEVLQRGQRPLLVHAEDASPEVDVFDREKVFLETKLKPLLNDFPSLKVVVEHITTLEAIAFVRDHRRRLAATITPHHLWINRNAMFTGGIRPHYYCLPVAKREHHRLGLIEAATSGESCFFLGTDSAPHAISQKLSGCGCAGIFSAPTALSLYAEMFALKGRLNQFEAFASLNGPRFYGLPVNENRVRLVQEKTSFPASVPLNKKEEVVVFGGGEKRLWTLA